MKNILDSQCPIEKAIIRSSFDPEEKDPVLKSAGNILCKEYNPNERERAERVYYWPHVPRKPGVFSFNW